MLKVPNNSAKSLGESPAYVGHDERFVFERNKQT
jgi:hypothetical protein